MGHSGALRRRSSGHPSHRGWAPTGLAERKRARRVNEGQFELCADLSNHALIATNEQGSGPGEASFYQDSTGVRMLYTPVMAFWGGPPRPVDFTRVGFTNRGAYVATGGPPSVANSLR